MSDVNTTPKRTFQILVTDKKGKVAPGVYKVEASAEFLAYTLAIDLFTNEKGVKPRNPASSRVAYYSRFSCRVVPT